MNQTPRSLQLARHRAHPKFDEIKSVVQVWADRQRRSLSEDEIRDRIRAYSSLESDIAGMEESEREGLLYVIGNDLLSEVRTVAPVGEVITRVHEEWLEERWGQQDWEWWKTYRRYLESHGRPPKQLNTLEEDTRNILEPAGDPSRDGTWARRGLVIGDVQSGKTATYIGLMNMAYDAGFRIFVIIGGHTEDLRSQSQKRVDEGFIGAVSDSSTDRNHVPDSTIGIGKIRRENHAFSVTTVDSDFGANSKRAANVTDIDATFQGPVVFVVKKNATILRNLSDWLRRSTPGEQFNNPMLVIDDESDYASVDTNREDQDPTAVNRAIRSILNLAKRSSYIGFTATPFANVLINPEESEDLFPRDFIYALYAPKNYMGAFTYFGEGQNEDTGVKGEAQRHMRLIGEDAELSFPFRHKKDHYVSNLPGSLKNAIDAFILACAIADFEGATEDDRSMLINVSRFKAVQEQVSALVEEYVEETRLLLENQIPLWSKDSPAPGVVRRLNDAWNREYAGVVDYDWEEILDVLIDSATRISVDLINADTAQERRLAQQRRAQQRIKSARRTIAVGGTILSRGITLNELVVSYFYQRTQLSDTLLQMGRWFGYRDKYRDLVRVWINDEVKDWFLFTAHTLDEIRSDVARMQSAGMSPEDFGLKVKKHPEALKITAANKMRHGHDQAVSLSFDRKVIQSKTATYSSEEIEANRSAFERLARHCVAAAESAESHTERVSSSRSLLFKNVERKVAEQFLQNFHPGPDSNFTSVADRGSWVSAYAASLDPLVVSSWDVVFVSGEGEEVQLLSDLEAPYTLNINQRNNLRLSKSARTHLKFEQGSVDTGSNLFSFAAQAANGLTRMEWDDLRPTDENGKRKPLARANVVFHIDRPILMIYRVNSDPSKAKNPDDVPAVKAEDFILGVVVAFPPERNQFGNVVESRSQVEYTVNKTWMKQAGLTDDESLLEVGDDVA